MTNTFLWNKLLSNKSIKNKELRPLLIKYNRIQNDAHNISNNKIQCKHMIGILLIIFSILF